MPRITVVKYPLKREEKSSVGALNSGGNPTSN